VRQRSARRHASRLDIDRYARQVSRPAGGTRLRVAVIGAGMAGLTAARILEDQGHEVTVVEKARGAGGRMSTRRANGWHFDHGAQYFTARDARFLRHVVAWRERGLVQEWPARIPQHDGETRYVAVPGMSAVCSETASGLADCRFEWPLHRAHFANGRWLLESRAGARLEADALVMTAPPDQAQALVPGEAVEQALHRVEMLPGWAVMAVLDRPLAEEWDARFVDRGPLGWLASQSSKPGRTNDAAWRTWIWTRTRSATACSTRRANYRAQPISRPSSRPRIAGATPGPSNRSSRARYGSNPCALRWPAIGAMVPGWKAPFSAAPLPPAGS
jgi:predicted NAD/FAD-dependent oxidoreductase